MTRSGASRGGLSREAQELLTPSPRLGVPIPAYGGRSIANIGPTVFAGKAATDPSMGPLAPPLDPAVDPFLGRAPEGSTLVVMVDGFGWLQFEEWSRRSPTGARWRAAARPLTTVFPSTTSAALTSLSTGVPPGRHGLVGYRQYLPKFGSVADMLKMSPAGVPTYDQLVGPLWRPEDVAGAPSLFRRYGTGVAVSRDRFRGTGFTRILYDGAEYVPYATASELAHEVVHVLERSPRPPVVYLYWDELDTVQHLQGVDDRLYALELERLANLLEYVARSLPERVARQTRVVVTGDHGQVPTGAETTLRIDALPEVAREMDRPLGGDRRAGFFAARPGRSDALRTALDGVLPDGSRVLSMDEVIDAGLFGPPPFHPEIRARTGDLLALVPSPYGLAYLPPGAPLPVRHLRSAHGGLEAAELLVPLVGSTLDELAGSSGAPPKR